MNRHSWVPLAVLVALWSAAPGLAQVRPLPATSADHCQILDSMTEPLWEVGLAFISESRIDNFADTAMTELNAGGEFAYFHDAFGGSIDLNLVLDVILFRGSGGIQLPNQLVQLAVDSGWSVRYANGWAGLVRLAPGLYSDLESLDAQAFNAPLTLAAIRAFDPSLSAIAGIQIRPGFERVIMPVIGCEWEINDAWRLAAKLPESELIYYIDDLWSAHAGFTWNNMTYAIREKGSFDRESLTVEDFRLWTGVTRQISNQFQITADIGHVFKRSLEFGKNEEDLGIDSAMDVESSAFLRLALGGPF